MRNIYDYSFINKDEPIFFSPLYLERESGSLLECYFFIRVTSKLIIIVVMICGKIVNPWVIIVMGIFSKLISNFIVFSSLYIKRYMAVSSLDVVRWLSPRVGVCHLADNSWFKGDYVSFFL